MKSHYFRPLLFAAKNKNSHKSTFNSRVSFIKLPKDRNILSFTKVQLSDVNFKKRQKTLMFEIVFLIYLFIYLFFFILKLKTIQLQSGEKFNSGIIQEKIFHKLFDVKELQPDKIAPIVFIIAIPCIIKENLNPLPCITL